MPVSPVVSAPKPRKEDGPRDSQLVSVQRSFGTAFGYNEILKRMERFFNYHFHRFLIQNKIKGNWKLMVYVSQDGAGDPPEASIQVKAERDDDGL